MRLVLNTLETSLVNVALVMFFILCALSVITSSAGIIITTRNLLFMFTGIAGVMISARLDEFRTVRLSKKRKRTLRIAQTLLFAFSLMVVMFALFELGVFSGLNRWD